MQRNKKIQKEGKNRNKIIEKNKKIKTLREVELETKKQRKTMRDRQRHRGRKRGRKRNTNAQKEINKTMAEIK